MKDKDRGMRDKDRGMRDEGRGTRDEGGGKIIRFLKMKLKLNI